MKVVPDQYAYGLESLQNPRPDAWLPRDARAPQARHRGLPEDSREVDAEAEETTIPDVESLPGQPRQGPRLHRLLRGPHGDLQDLVRPGVPGSDRRRGVHFNVTEYPTAEWTGLQFVQAFPGDLKNPC